MPKTHEATGNMVGEEASLTNAPKPEKDMARKIDQSKVTSKVKVDGTTTIRTYSDGAVQRLTHHDADAAKAYAASVAEQEG